MRCIRKLIIVFVFIFGFASDGFCFFGFGGGPVITFDPKNLTIQGAIKAIEKQQYGKLLEMVGLSKDQVRTLTFLNKAIKGEVTTDSVLREVGVKRLARDMGLQYDRIFNASRALDLFRGMTIKEWSEVMAKPSEGIAKVINKQVGGVDPETGLPRRTRRSFETFRKRIERIAEGKGTHIRWGRTNRELTNLMAAQSMENAVEDKQVLQLHAQNIAAVKEHVNSTNEEDKTIASQMSQANQLAVVQAEIEISAADQQARANQLAAQSAVAAQASVDEEIKRRNDSARLRAIRSAMP